MRHSHHSRRHHDIDGMYSTDRFSLHALWHALSREQYREGGRERHEGRGEREGRGHARSPRGFEDFFAARGAFPERFALHALWHAIGRHQHHRGERGGDRSGRFGGPGGPGGFGGDGDGFPRGRKFSSDDLQLLLLALLDAQPSHGYELIKALETRSNGFYSPSPGMVYPALTYLEEIGFVTVQLEGNRKRYELADAGRQHLADNRERAEMMLAKLNHIARKMDSVRRAFAGEEPLDPSEGGWLPELIEARRALKHALFRRDNVPADEQRRIAAILARATAEIEGKPDAGTNTGTDAGAGDI
ncbi:MULTISPECIES: PadR family transcriptional regulator [Paraburkholderia]|jgi:DNA-binding PadR family transcriptional regulator|uniref:DNA-binding transcriptional regulator, PadR family n=1 Tax=Paraburkholderia phenazinium TaxID=60549 RepID=A0A1N6KEE8_9BURK|nr:PadR family transcriptional regulator [Paraburkholderia phenazinium]SIO54932.1 DNA-binding transcriptional regulator, PadR family [Paraburkholderia phenazinium]